MILSTKAIHLFLLSTISLFGTVECFISIGSKSISTIRANTSLAVHNDKNNYNQDSSPSDGLWNRRKAINAALSALVSIPNMALAVSDPVQAISSPKFTQDVSWPLGKVAFSLLPLAGTSSRRATVMETIVPDSMWTFDQIQGVVNVNVPVRMTVIKLSEEAGGGLWVYNPLAPTPQLIKMMKQLEIKYGPVKHIVLGTVALEHKATFGPFAQNYPEAEVWIQPGQWSFPFTIPIELSGVIQRGKRLHEIPNPRDESVSLGYNYYNKVPEWTSDFDYETLGPLTFQSVGAYSETAFFHKPSKTLLVTDCVIKVSDEPPLIIQEDPRAMLFHARDSIDDIVTDTPENRKRGWRRMVQFGLVFFPSQIDVVPFGKAISQAIKIDKSMKPLGEGAVPFSLYPWTWHANNADQRNFDAILNAGLFCPPILTKLILDREPEKTLDWVNRISSKFDFKRVIPCHLENNIAAGPEEFRKAFDVLENNPSVGKEIKPQRPLAEDLALLQEASDILTRFGVVGPSKVCDGEPARIVGRFAEMK